MVGEGGEDLNAPTWDLFIGLFFIVGVAYGFILQREKVVVTLVTVYVSLVATQTLMPIALQFFAGDKTLFNSIYLRANTSPFAIQAGIFVLLIMLLTVRSGLTGHKAHGFLIPIEVLIYSGLNSALVLSSILSFMPAEAQASLATSSKFARLIIAYHTWWLVLPVFMLIVTGIRAKRDESLEY